MTNMSIQVAAQERHAAHVYVAYTYTRAGTWTIHAEPRFAFT